ncbi:MAG: hypothetical protein AAF824_09765 [Bacteroidota bacterium]
MKHISLCLLWLCCLCMSCKEDSSPTPEESFDVKITGRVYDAFTDKGYGGVNIQAVPPSYAKWTRAVPTMTDGKGNFEIRLNMVGDTLLREDLSMEDILSYVNPVYQGMSIRLIQDNCLITHIDKHFPLTRFQDAFKVYPYEIQLEYPVVEATDFLLHLQTGEVQNPVTAEVYLRDLSNFQSYTNWSPLELELQKSQTINFCAPANREVEVVVSFVEYSRDPFTILADKIMVDTFRMSSDIPNKWTVSYQ